MELISHDKEKREMTEVLGKYKKLKDESHATASRCVENNEKAIGLLREKNNIAKQMQQRGASREEVMEAEIQAYKDAGLYQGKD